MGWWLDLAWVLTCFGLMQLFLLYTRATQVVWSGRNLDRILTEAVSHSSRMRQVQRSCGLLYKP